MPSTRTIFTLSRNKLTLSQVTLGGEPSISFQTESSWQPNTVENITQTLETLVKAYPTEIKKCRLLLEDDVCYLINQEVSQLGELDTSDREAIFSTLVSTQIPEILLDDEWDFAVTTDQSQQETLVIFAPVLSIFRRFLEATQQLYLEIVAIEPTHLATTRHSSAVVGLALKKQLAGPDTTVLNIEPSPTATSGEKTAVTKKFFMWLLGFSVLLFFVSVGVTFWWHTSLAK